MSIPLSPSIFLSYSRRNKDVMQRVVVWLRQQGFNVWVDNERLTPGTPIWEAEIETAIASAGAAIVLLSPEAKKSEWVRAEIEYAKKNRKRVYPVLVDGDLLTSVPLGLLSHQFVDLRKNEAAGLEELAEALRTYFATRSDREDVAGHPSEPEYAEEDPLGRDEDLPGGAATAVRIASQPEPLEAVSSPAGIPDSGTLKPGNGQAAGRTSVPAAARDRGRSRLGWIIGLLGLCLMGLCGVGVVIFILQLSPPGTPPYPEQPTPTDFPVFTEPPAPTEAPVFDATPTFVPPEPTPVPNNEFIFDEQGIAMILVPAGEFWMGSDSGFTDQGPIHLVYLAGYYIDFYEVTNAAYQVCVLNGVCGEPQDTSHYLDSAYTDHPVVYVDWYAAESYCEWRGARLPSEAEWEKAARGTDERTYPWGEGIDGSYANYNSERQDTTPAGSFENGMSPYGIYDMAGNVFEWVFDWYSEAYYQDSPGSNPFGPDTGETRALRGGGWPHSEEYVRSSYRLGIEPTFNNFDLGFRCARYAP